MNDPYTEDYYLRGKESGLSLYHDYRWLPKLTIPMAERIAEHLGMELDDCVMDFGCARGFLVRAFQELGFPKVVGYDVSKWALENCDETLKGRGLLASEFPHVDIDWIIAKDVLEHVDPNDLRGELHRFERVAQKGIFIVVPLSPGAGAPYVVPEYEKDVTHQIRWSMACWWDIFQAVFGPGWSVCAQYLLPGIKENYSHFEKGNGFFTIRRVSRLSSPS